MTHFLKFSSQYLLLIVIFLFVSALMPASLSFGKTENKPPKYIGSEVCKNCHKKEYRSFMRYAKKAKSFESIEKVKKGLKDEEIEKCYFCHTTGYGKKGGFINPEKTPHLKNAGCEVCHGPGEFHAKTKSRRDIKRRMAAEDCEICHTAERVDAFRYKPLIHGGAH